jgi:hypothetical protein
VGNAVLTGWRRDHWRPFLQSLRDGISILLHFTGVHPRPTLSVGPLPLLDIFRDMTRERLAGLDARVRRIRVTGRMTTRDGGGLSLELHDKRGPAEGFSVDRFARPEPGAAPGFSTAGFVLRGYCPDGCSLVITERGRELTRFSVGSTPPTLSGVAIDVDDISPEPSVPRQERLDERRYRILDLVLEGYRLVLPALAAIGLLCWLTGGFYCCLRRRVSTFWLASSAALTGCITRLVLLGIVSANAFPAMNALYLSPIPPLLLLFCALSIGAVRPLIVELGTGRREASPAV